MTWLNFAIVSLIFVALLYVPGALLLGICGARRNDAIVLSPLATTFMIATLGIVYNKVGVFANWKTILGIPTLILLAGCILHWKISHTQEIATQSDGWLPIILIYLAIAIVLTVLIYASNIGSPLAYQPDNDNSHHLNLIQSMASSGNYSSLSANLYASNEASPVISSSFYPAAFHSLCATMISLLGVQAIVAENALVAAVLSVVYPMAIYRFLREISSRKSVVLGGAIVCLLIFAFPWRLISWGPLYPYMLSMALVPLGFVVFVSAIRSFFEHSGRTSSITQCIITLGALGLSHPSSLFLLAIFLVFYFAQWLYLSTEPRGEQQSRSDADHLDARNSRNRAILLVIFLLAAATLWTAAFKLPVLQGLVSFTWSSTSTFSNALWALVSLRLTDVDGQVIIPIVVAIGIYVSMREAHRYGWLLAVIGFTAIQFLVCFVAGAPLKHFLCGFWYTDQHRIAANYCLAIVPVCAIGLGSILESVRVHISNRISFSQSAFLVLTGIIACLGILFAAFLTPTRGVVSAWGIPLSDRSHSLPSDAAIDSVSSINAKFGDQYKKGYDSNEKDFVDLVMKVVPTGSTLINIPCDGSCFSYALQGAKVYYRSMGLASGNSGNETEDSRVIRTELNEIATNKQVQHAVADIGARYVLVLDKGTMAPDGANVLPPYFESVWEGISSINDDTPGFEVVLSEGDMRLYKIVLSK